MKNIVLSALAALTLHSGAHVHVHAPTQAHAQPQFTSDDTFAAMEGASARAACIVRYEVGGVGYDPYARGAQGERGIAQLHPYGLLLDFAAQGYTDADNPYQAIAYLDAALARGLARHWAPVLQGMC